MHRVEPRQPDQAGRGCVRRRARFPGRSEHQAETRGQRPEFRRGNQGQIHLQRAGQQKGPVNPGAGLDVGVMHRSVPPIETCRPVCQNIRHPGPVRHRESQVDVRPPVFAPRCRRARNRGAGNPPVAGGIFEKFRSQPRAFFRGKHGFSNSMRSFSPP